MIRKIASSRRFAWLLIVVGFSGLVISGVLYLQGTTSSPRPPRTSGITVARAPSSVRPSAKSVTTYSVPPDDPKYISIPNIGVSNTRVMQLGLLKSGAIATPDNIYDTGWYQGSARPGESGAMFIFGHVSSWTANGVFYNLKKLKPGDVVTVTKGNNTKYTYEVMSSKVYPYDHVDMKAVLSPIDANKPGLNLMTCTGEVIKGTSEFDERLVVFTSLMRG